MFEVYKTDDIWIGKDAGRDAQGKEKVRTFVKWRGRILDNQEVVLDSRGASTVSNNGVYLPLEADIQSEDRVRVVENGDELVPVVIRKKKDIMPQYLEVRLV